MKQPSLRSILTTILLASVPAGAGLTGCASATFDPDANTTDPTNNDPDGRCGRCGCAPRGGTQMVQVEARYCRGAVVTTEPTDAGNDRDAASAEPDAQTESDASAPDDASEPSDAAPAESDAGAVEPPQDLDPATCEIDCNRACAGLTFDVAGYPRQWGNTGIGSGSSTCYRASATTVACSLSLPCGRAPEGLADVHLRPEASSIGAYLVRAAYLEAASVDAFERLAIELRAHGAPDSLVRAALRSAREERVHAEDVGQLARAYGEATTTPAPAPRDVRPLAEVLHENAVEGCARETYGALLALYQSEHAEDPAVRALMARIARDEVRHASLAWAVAAWAESSLDEDSRARVSQAREAAWEGLLATLANPAPESLARPLGLPPAAQATQLATALRAQLAPRLARA